MNTNLTQKERTLLEDQKSHEEICIKKYTNYANQAQSQQLKQIFTNLANQERQHYNTINQILNGQVPNTQQNQQSGQGMQNQQQGMQSSQGMQSGMQNNMGQGQGQGTAGMVNENDKALCTDMLMTEKYVSGAYDTAIFEFTNSNIRQTLNHIQKEEQQHGEQIFNYMQSNGMYNAQ